MLHKSTASRLAKTKKPLTDFNQLRQAVKKLQQDGEDQLHLEIESQATFEYLGSEIKALKSAFSTLSDVLLAEVDGIRKETVRKNQMMEAELKKQLEFQKQSQSDITQLKQTLDLWSMKERDWAKDNEVLKASHSHNVDWMQQLQRDIMSTRDQVHSMKQEYTIKVKDLVEESSLLRANWEKQVEAMREKLNQYDILSKKQLEEVRSHAEQRLDDLELTEQALGTVQKQQLHLRTFVDESVHNIISSTNQLEQKTDMFESKFESTYTNFDKISAKMNEIELNQNNKFNRITKVLAVFADTLNISTSTNLC